MIVYVHSHQKKPVVGDAPLPTRDLAALLKDQGIKNVLSSDEQLSKLDKADLFIVEVSSPSIQAGYVVAYAVNMRKPILCLYHHSINKKDVAYLTEGVSAKLIRLIEYGVESIEDVLFSFLRQKRKKEIVTTKFTLRVPPSVVEYLNWKQQYSHKSKAALIRDGFIEEVITKDEAYQAHQRHKNE